MLRFLDNLQLVVYIAFILAYAYQLIYLFIGLLGKGPQGKQNAALHRYAVMIAARNEQTVIGDLIASLKKQQYPQELIDIYVVADNCTDRTAEVSRKAGASVYERFNKRQVGKGYALDYLLHRIFEDRGDQYYDGFFVFDADNLVDARFVSEMNRMFDTGRYAALTSYRNSKNFCDNWITAGYSLWFLREARYLSQPRAQLGVNCAISGTGFLVSADVIREKGGWPYHLLTEDIEFSVSCAVEGRKIGYCGTAMVYDEQPTEFRQSWDQRLRWSKGFYQINAHYTGALLRGCTRGGRRGASCYDMLMTVAPGNLVCVGIVALFLVVLLSALWQPAFLVWRALRLMGHFIAATFLGIYKTMLLFGFITVLTEWKRIDGAAWKKLMYTFTFPLFMMTYIPISVAALVSKVEWKPIRHGVSQRSRERA